MKYALQTNNNIASICRYHVVFCLKYRRKVLVNGIDERLNVLIREIVETWGQELIGMQVMPDHVHLLLAWKMPTVWEERRSSHAVEAPAF